MLDRIIVLQDGCVEEVGTYSELASNPHSRFSSYLAVLAETGKVADEQSPVEEEIDDAISLDDDARSENCLETTDEPEVAKIVEPSPPRKRSLNRKLSSTLDREELDTDGALTTDEFKERVIGSVGLQVYLDWCKAAGGFSIIIWIMLLFVFVEVLTVSSKWWLTHWSQKGGTNAFFYLGM
jgi:ABC-type Fe3+/spermidine/putrescine transport system ATPase subunit